MSAFTPQTSVDTAPAIALAGQMADTGFTDKISRILSLACLAGLIVCGDDATAEVPDAAIDVTGHGLGMVIREEAVEPSETGFAAGRSVSILRWGRGWVQTLSGAAPTDGSGVYVYRGATAADRGKVTQDSGAGSVTRLEGAKFTGRTASGLAEVQFEGIGNSDGSAALVADLASTSGGQGASLIGIQDAGAFTSAATVEAALAEIYQHIKSTQAHIPLSLYDFREVDASSDVGNAAANGGLLASDTTPILRGNAAESQEISWAAGNVDPIALQTTLPPDFDGSANVTLELWVNSGTTNGASFTVETGWDGGALVSDAVDDSATKSATTHKVTATIAAADVPDTAAFLTLVLTPPTHATDAIQLLGARLLYKRKLLTS